MILLGILLALFAPVALGVLFCQLLLWIDPLQDVGKRGEALLAQRMTAVRRGEIPADLSDMNAIDDWEDVAVHWYRQGRDLSALELIQHKLSADFEEAKVKLLKLDESTE